MKSTSTAVNESDIDIVKILDAPKKEKRPGTSPADDNLFRMVADYARDVIFCAKVKPAFQFVYVSPSSTRITGYTPEEFYADPTLARNCVIREDQQLIADTSRWINVSQSKPTEIRWKRKDGKIIWTEHLISVVNDDEGQPDFYHIIARDITERKESEILFREGQQFNVSLLENAPNATMVISSDTSVKYVNPAWEKINGWTAKEVLGAKSPYPWWPDEYREIFVEGFKEAMRQGNGNSEIFAQKKNGEIYWIAMNWVSLMKNGQMDYMIINSVDITDRVKAQEALKESESKYRSIFESANDIIVLLDREGTIIDINNKLASIAGYERNDLLGQKFMEVDGIMPESSRREVTANFLKRLAGEDIPPYEVEMYKNNGEPIFFELSAVPLKINDKVAGNVVILRDVTNQKHSLQALKESEEKFSKAFMASPNPVCIVTVKEGVFLDVNDSYLRFCGYSREEVIGHTPNDLDLWIDKDEEAEMGKSLATTDRIHNMQIHSRMKTGEIRTGLFSAEAIEIGGVKCVTIVITDITKQQKAEEALANEAIRRHILIEQSSDGIVIINQDGNVQEANQRFADMLGYTFEEAQNLTVLDWEFSHTKEKTLEMVRSVTEKGNHFESQHRRKDGSIFDVEISCNGATFAGKKLVFCVCRDITERKLIEQSLRESEEKFSKAFSSSPAMIAILNFKDKKYIEANDSFARCLGYTRDEVIGVSPHTLDIWINPEEEKKMARLMDKYDRIYNEEYRFRTKTGEIRTWLSSAEVINIGGNKCVLSVSTDITERKKVQVALHESEEKFAKAFRSIPSSISISRISDGKFIEVNDSFLRDKGYKREEVIGCSTKDINLFISEEDNNKMRNALMNNEKFDKVEKEYRTKSGEIRTGLISAEVINIANEPCMLVINTDITRQKAAEKQIRLLGSVTQQVTDATVIADPELKITYINKAAEEMFGYTLDEAQGKQLNYFDKVKPNKISSEAFNKLLKTGEVYTSVVPKRRKDGTSLLCDCRLSPLVNEKGEIISLIDVQRDITKEKEIEKKLQEHKKLIDSILATTPEGVLVIDNENHIILANKSFYKIFRLNSRSLRNMLFSDIFPEDQFTDLYKEVKLGQKEKSSLEFRYQERDQEKIIDCVVVKMDNDFTLLTFSDVSREREEEEKLYLTSRLASIGEMAAGLAHELNNPLTGILTLSQLLVSTELPAEQKEDVECIYTEAKRAAAIVKNVLLFARSRSGDSGRSYPNEVIKDVFRLREYEQRTNNIKVVMNLDEAVPEIMLDKGQLQQVCLNLISNAEAAIKEANRPGVITVTTQRVNNHINITFTDNGSGIKKQVINRIFDPFFTTKEIGKGTGLGLSICYSIIVKHGGKINVNSQVNEGATFSIKMPVAM
jgi:PAS domain S-box-containing protein